MQEKLKRCYLISPEFLFLSFFLLIFPTPRNLKLLTQILKLRAVFLYIKLHGYNAKRIVHIIIDGENLTFSLK